MDEKCLCSRGHPETFRGKRACRIIEVRAKGVLWHHASVNLVEPRSVAPAAA